MFKYISLLFIFISFTACTEKNNIEKIFNNAVSENFSGSILVASEGEIIFTGANGKRDFENDIPLVSSDIFELASISKQFTAMMVMICKEKGLLDYDDLVSEYLDIPYKGISIRNLLTHTSGLPDYQVIMDKFWDKSKVAGNPEILEYLDKYRPDILFSPGDQYRYSNTGYVLLGSIVEKVTGGDFVKLSKEWIFDPLKMENTLIRTLEEKKNLENLAFGHKKDSLGRYVNANNFLSSDYTIWLGNRKGPGRISSNIFDLLLWDQALFTENLVLKKTIEEAFSPYLLNDKTLSYYGFGWRLNKDLKNKIVSHSGSNPGYKTRIVRLLDKRKTIIILSNNDFSLNKIEQNLINELSN
ncbi:beta-lactamase family protein [Bacteroidota bacterium]|nr:beta-lactamase family protein [Bacteroidota bacterium]